MANICRTKHDRDNRARALASTKVLLRCLKISWTSGPQDWTVVFTHPHYCISFCPSASHTLCAALMWHLRATLNETALGSSASQIFLSFFRHILSELAKWNSTKIGHMVRSKCNLKTHPKSAASPSPTNRESKNYLFSTTSHLNSNFNCLYISGKKHEVNNRASALTTTRGLLRRVQKWLQTGPPFLPTLRKYCFLLHYQASRTPANRTELNFAKWWMVNRANNLP